MAGLLDIFGTGGTESLGLLGMSAEDIKRARDNAQAQAMFSLAGRLFQGGNTGASIAQGLQMGQQAYKQALQGQLADKLQSAQLQDMITKRQEAQAAKQRQAQIQQILGQAYQPAVAGQPAQMVEEEGRYIGETPAVAARPAGFDIQSIAPALMATPEGRAELSSLMNIQKSMAGDTFSLAEGATQFQRNPFTGQISKVAEGIPKKEKEDIAGDVKEAMQVLGINTPVKDLTVTDRALIKAYIDRKDTNKSPKVAVDLKDPTAVAKAQLATINQWQNTLKDTGDTTVAGRASAFYDAYAQTKKGNTSGDGAMIYNIAKVYDQTGAVQQNDVGTIIGNRSIPTNIQLFAQKLQKGGTFTQPERENLKKIVDGIVSERQKSLEPSLKVYRKLNQDQGGSSDAIINPYDAVKKPRSLEEILGFGRPRGGN